MSKNRTGSLGQMRVMNKSVVVTAVPECPERCHVMVLDMYFSKLPPEAFEKDNFYVQPVTSVDPAKLWFTTKPVGRNTLSRMVKDICNKGRIEGNKTNHSLRATGVSELFQAGVPEKLIQERSGHLSLDGLRQYQRTTVSQHEAVSKVLTSGSTYQNSVAAVGQEKAVSTLLVSRSMHQQYTPQEIPQPPQMNFTSCNVTIYNGPCPSVPTNPLLEVTNVNKD